MIKKLSEFALPFIDGTVRSSRTGPKAALAIWVQLYSPVFFVLSYLEQLEYWLVSRKKTMTAAVVGWIIEMACVPHLLGICGLAILFPVEVP